MDCQDTTGFTSSGLLVIGEKLQDQFVLGFFKVVRRFVSLISGIWRCGNIKVLASTMLKAKNGLQ